MLSGKSNERKYNYYHKIVEYKNKLETFTRNDNKHNRMNEVMLEPSILLLSFNLDSTI